jgi:hypothetical protein
MACDKFAADFTAPFFQRANHIICESFPTSMDEIFDEGPCQMKFQVR